MLAFGLLVIHVVLIELINEPKSANRFDLLVRLLFLDFFVFNLFRIDIVLCLRNCFNGGLCFKNSGCFLDLSGCVCFNHLIN